MHIVFHECPSHLVKKPSKTNGLCKSGFIAVFLLVLPEKSSRASFLMFELAVFKLHTSGITLGTVILAEISTLGEATMHHRPYTKQP